MNELPTTKPQDVGLDKGQLARIDRHLARYVESGSLPGALFAIARRGRIAHFSVQGLMDRERGRALSADTIVRIYSMTKPITSVALMMLFEEGRFQLDDPVAKFIPAFADIKVYAGGTPGAFQTAKPARPLTVRDLFTHLSGFTYGLQQRTPVDAAYRERKLEGGERPLNEWTQVLAELPLEFSPGEHWNYSCSTDVLGYLGEVLAGEPLDEFLRKRIFTPLDMKDTAFFVPPEKWDRFAACYQRSEDGAVTLTDDPETSRYRAKPVFLSGGGGLVSTARDYLRFAQMLCNGGTLDGVRILGPKTLALMTRNHLPGGKDLHALSVSMFSEASMAGVGFGLGFAVMLDPVRNQLPGTPGEFNWGGVANTYFWVDPAEELVVVQLAQVMPPFLYNLRRELRGLVYAALTD
jgi:CubicO group peptidase (beta-lactamase class C family)